MDDESIIFPRVLPPMEELVHNQSEEYGICKEPKRVISVDATGDEDTDTDAP